MRLNAVHALSKGGSHASRQQHIGRGACRAHAAQVGGGQHVSRFGVVDNEGVQAQAARVGALLQRGRRPLRRQRRRRRRRRILPAGLRPANSGSAGDDA